MSYGFPSIGPYLRISIIHLRISLNQKNDVHVRAYGVPFYYLFPIFGYPINLFKDIHNVFMDILNSFMDILQ